MRKRVVFKHGDCNVVQGNVAKRRRRYMQVNSKVTLHTHTRTHTRIPFYAIDFEVQQQKPEKIVFIKYGHRVVYLSIVAYYISIECLIMFCFAFFFIFFSFLFLVSGYFYDIS